MTLDDDTSMTRSEERLAITTRRVPIGRAVLRKVVVIEERTITVEVAHEEVRLEVVPFDGDETESAEARGAHVALPELVLSEEQIVVTTRTVPVERVRLVIDSVDEARVLTEELARERVEVSDILPSA